MKRILFAVSILLVAWAGWALARGDLSRENLVEVQIRMGTADGKMYFRPDQISLETGKAYKLVLINEDVQKHELEAEDFVDRIFTRKLEVMGPDGQMIAEIKGPVREVEINAKGHVDWYLVPVQTGTDIEMVCGIAGHKQAGMKGKITIQ